MNVSNWPTYHYRASLARVVDGDTVRVFVDLGMRITREVSLRLQDIDAPEVYGKNATPEGATASDALRGLVADTQLYVSTEKDRKSFDRYVAHLYVDTGDGTLASIGDALVDLGHAERTE